MRAPRSIAVDRSLAGRTLLDVLRTSLHLSGKEAARRLRERQVRISGGVCTDRQRRLKIGQYIQLDEPARKQDVPDDTRAIVLRHIDDQIVVVEKPAGLTTVRHADEVESAGRGKKHLPP